LDDCTLTLKDLSTIESCFNKILLGIYHHRIDYPAARKPDARKPDAKKTETKKPSATTA
jgi:cyclic-di-AMP phosphodiesterase PgpH